MYTMYFVIIFFHCYFGVLLQFTGFVLSSFWLKLFVF
jgi:hypothetical protein